MTLDELQVEFTKQSDELKAIKVELEAQKETNNKLQEENTRLLKSNNDLFARITNEPDDKQDDVKDKTPEEEEQEAIDDIKKLMNERRY